MIMYFWVWLSEFSLDSWTCLLTHVGIIWICVMSCVRLASQQAGWMSCVAKTCRLFNQSCSHLPCFRHHWPLPFCTTHTDHDLCWGSQGQRKAKLGYIFSNTFQLIRMRFDMMLKQFKLNIPILFWVGFSETRQISAVLLTASINFNIGMLSDVCGLIWFKHGMMIDTIVVYILILV